MKEIKTTKANEANVCVNKGMLALRLSLCVASPVLLRKGTSDAMKEDWSSADSFKPFLFVVQV